MNHYINILSLLPFRTLTTTLQANVKQCVSVHEYLDNEGGFVLINLHPADYTLTIRAISLGNIFGM